MSKVFIEDAITLMSETIDLKGFAPSTKKDYLGHLKRFSEFCNKHPKACGYEDIRRFLLHMIKVRKLSSQSVNSAIGALKFYYEFALCRNWDMKQIPRAKRKHFLPTILTTDEVNRIIDHIANLKHKAMLATIYSSGLRVSEVAQLKISDIDSKNMRVFVRQSKGNKDRNTILSEKNLLMLREYYRQYKPKEWLFPGINPLNPISIRNIQTVFSNTVRALGINKKVSVHSLRHSFATHLLNNGASILQIKDLLGHTNIQTTTRYLHLTDSQILNFRSPYDMAKDGDING